MRSLAKLDASGVLYHIMGRGIEKRKIFLNDDPGNDFFSQLAALTKDESMVIHIRATLPNQIQLI
jgi:putative transposase